MILQRASAKAFIISPRWGASLKNNFLVKSLGDVTFAEERILKEREEKKGGGRNFGRSVAGKNMRKEGLGAVGLLPRSSEWETGIQRDRKRGDGEAAALLFDL